MNSPVMQTLILAAGLLLFQPLAAQQYYKWVDDEGVTHYSAEKPEGKDASRVEAKNPPSSSQDKAMQRLEQQREQNQAAREAGEEDEQAEEDPQAANEENCEQHRKNLETLNQRSVVRREDPETGEKKTLDEEQRQAMIEKTKKALERCNENNEN